MATNSRRDIVFTLCKRLSLVDTVAEVLPISSAGWDRVAELHQEVYVIENCTADSLKRKKFNELCCKPAPTGDPKVPEDVCLAKQVHQIIVCSVNASTGMNHDNEDDGEEYASDIEFDEAFDAPPAVPTIPIIPPLPGFPGGGNMPNVPGAGAAMAVAAMAYEGAGDGVDAGANVVQDIRDEKIVRI